MESWPHFCVEASPIATLDSQSLFTRVSSKGVETLSLIIEPIHGLSISTYSCPMYGVIRTRHTTSSMTQYSPREETLHHKEGGKEKTTSELQRRRHTRHTIPTYAVLYNVVLGLLEHYTNPLKFLHPSYNDVVDILSAYAGWNHRKTIPCPASSSKQRALHAAISTPP